MANLSFIKAGMLFFSISISFSLFHTNAQYFTTGDFTTPREIITISNTTFGGATRAMVAYGDFNSDNKIDVVKVGVNQIMVLENIYTSGDISNSSISLFNNLNPMSTGTGSKNVIVSDINNDGKQDILVGCDNSASVFINNSTGGTISFNSRVDISSYGPNVALYDIDKDGWLDLVHSSNSYYTSIGINLNDNSAGIFSNTTFDFTVPYGSMEDWVFEDFNADGTKDFFSARADSNSSNTGIYLSENTSTVGTVSFGPLNFKTIPGMVYASYGSPKSISTADLDNDTKKDLLVQLGDKTHFFLNTHSNNTLDINNFTESNITSQNASYNFGLNFGIGDINNDGKIDLISPGSNTSGTFVMKNNSTVGNIAFYPSFDIQSITNQTSLIVDLDGDNLPEIINAQYYSDKVYVVKYSGAVLSNPDNDFQSISFYPNPVETELIINSNDVKFIFKIYSMTGKLILQTKNNH